jgi:hypothetical protein
MLWQQAARAEVAEEGRQVHLIRRVREAGARVVVEALQGVRKTNLRLGQVWKEMNWLQQTSGEPCSRKALGRCWRERPSTL